MFVTTFSKRILEDYARQTVATWAAHSAQRIVVVANPEDVDDFSSALGARYEIIEFSDASLSAIAAIRQREAELNRRRDDYRFQAARFSWKVFAMADAFAAASDEADITWLDADSVLRPGVDPWLQGLFSRDHAVSFLGRAHKQLHVESGLVNLRGATGREIYGQVIEVYRSGRLFDFNEWHDGYVVTPFFQYSRHAFDISRRHGVRSSNPLYEIDRGRHVLHLKGQRKGSSVSLLDDLRVLLRR